MLETWEYSPPAIRKTVSTSGSSRWFVSVMPNSYSMSESVRRPRRITRAPIFRTNWTVNPSNDSHRDVGKRLEHVPGHLDALVDVEERRLVDVDADADDQVIEKEPAALDHVEMTERDRVERAGEDGRAIRCGRIGYSLISGQTSPR